jgi:hypothetical protein
MIMLFSSFSERRRLAQGVLEVLVGLLLDGLSVLKLANQLHLQHLHLHHFGLLLSTLGFFLVHTLLVLFFDDVQLSFLFFVDLQFRVLVLLLSHLLLELVFVIHLLHVLHLLLLVLFSY